MRDAAPNLSGNTAPSHAPRDGLNPSIGGDRGVRVTHRLEDPVGPGPAAGLEWAVGCDRLSGRSPGLEYTPRQPPPHARPERAKRSPQSAFPLVRVSLDVYPSVHDQERVAAREYAPLYDAAYDTAFWQSERRMFANEVRRAARRARLDLHTCRALDVGSGTGAMLGELRRLGVRDLFANDISTDMARIAELKFPDVGFSIGPVESAAYPAGSLDLVTGFSVLHHLPDLASFFEWLAGVLTPGGICAFSDPNASSILQRRTMARAAKLSTLPLQRLLQRRNRDRLVEAPDMSNDRFYSEAHRSLSRQEISEAVPPDLEIRLSSHCVLLPYYSSITTHRRLDRIVLRGVAELDRALPLEGYILTTIGRRL